MPNPNIDWTHAPDGANGWQIIYGRAAWVKVHTQHASLQTLTDVVDRMVPTKIEVMVVDSALLYDYAGPPEDSFTPMPPWGRKDPREIIEGLGYEALRALRIMEVQPNKEGSAIASQADCSWDELFELARRGFTVAGFDRLLQYQVHPELTAKGKLAAAVVAHLFPDITASIQPQ